MSKSNELESEMQSNIVQAKWGELRRKGSEVQGAGTVAIPPRGGRGV